MRSIRWILVSGLALAACSSRIENVDPPLPDAPAVVEDVKRVADPPGDKTVERVESAGEVLMTASRPAPGQMSRMASVDIPVDPYAGERYAEIDTNGIKQVSASPVSTFGIDVDTGAYSNVRRFLNMGRLPPKDAVRIEEMINYFTYDYPPPKAGDPAFTVTTEVAVSPWNDGKHLLMVGLKGYEVGERMPANLVFLIDVSGSMQSADKLGLVKASLRMLTRHLRADDRIAIVTYAGNAGVALESVAGSERLAIDAAIAALTAGGSTYGEGGLREAYRLARAHYRDDAINRVILATDGDFNVGISDVDALKDYITDQREHGIGLTTLGFGTGNYNDHLLEQLADVGNGNHAYIDNLNEARKVLVQEASSTFQTIASDVKIQIEFNPAVVAEYRLVGYENRRLAREDFNNDKVDAGEIGAGHTVTALYEIALVDGQRAVDDLRYRTDPANPGAPDELAFVKLRYKPVGAAESVLLERPVMTADIRPLDAASDSLGFAAAVAGLGQLLGDDRYIAAGYDDILDLARDTAAGNVYRTEFVNLVELARDVATPLAAR